MREIVLEINNEYVKQSSRFGGVQGAGNVTGVKLCFDESWDGFTKTLIWFNAYGENPVFQALTVDMAEDKDYRIYTATIPKEPLEFWGSCSLVIEGLKDSALAKSVRVELEVEPCPDTSSAQQSADPTPTLAQQLQREIEGIKTDIDKVVENSQKLPYPENDVWQVWNGTEYISTGKSSKGDKGDTGAQGVHGEKGKDGTNGKDGYSPVRGVDYWTESDKAEIKSYVDDAILGGAW